ncbi:right-handed parallel beta-helix repeat-containing protein [Neisseria musculi]|uniref:Right handed beta helix region family protein n=1 Tax=Neisseria musculi TaxID=1815583 RepID=A0A7H1MF14_9NEIS|nr:right-handed parallel beta-helix repeat-containing protein [Neisseria musculi]QNT60229.1 right handed beta helix region family protein [Neisseria musculi]
MANYVVRTHAKHGKYIDIRHFKTATNTYNDAVKAALAAAHKEKAALYLTGTITISGAIEINAATRNVTGIFGDGMGKTKILFTHKQTGVHNPNSNATEPEKAGIWINGQNGKFVSDLSVQYKHTAATDFYRTGQSYFGKISGIVVNDADHTLISRVEVSGANRAGVLFTSTSAISSGAKDNLTNGKITAAQLPTGDNNKIIDSNLHHNRVSGVMVAFQKNFTAENNTFAWNGHEKDGGTGYGISLMAGSYNNGATITGNTTNHNYRKGIDSHDGNNIVIKNNTLNGDRMYGISVENRQFSMDKVTIQNNTITQDPSFRLTRDDNTGIPNAGSDYIGYRGIKLENKGQDWQKFINPKAGVFNISNNTINNLTDGLGITRAIEARNNEKDVSYTLNISNNKLAGSSADNLISIFGKSDNSHTAAVEAGPGSGNIRIIGNNMSVKKTTAAPIYIEEKQNADRLNGSVAVNNNTLKISQAEGATKAVTVESNAATVSVTGNTFNVSGGPPSQPVVRATGTSKSHKGKLTVADNTFDTDSSKAFENGDWLKTEQINTLRVISNIHSEAAGIAGNNGATPASIAALKKVTLSARAFPIEAESDESAFADIGTTTVSRAATENIVFHSNAAIRSANTPQTGGTELLDTARPVNLGKLGIDTSETAPVNTADQSYAVSTQTGGAMLQEDQAAAVL